MVVPVGIILGGADDGRDRGGLSVGSGADDRLDLLCPGQFPRTAKIAASPTMSGWMGARWSTFTSSGRVSRRVVAMARGFPALPLTSSSSRIVHSIVSREAPS